jgi:hypothetical protein
MKTHRNNETDRSYRDGCPEEILEKIKKIITNVTIRQQIRLEETIVKETEQKHLTWYGHVQRMVERRLPK